MEIQEPSPRIILSAFRFGKVSPLLLDRRGELIARLGASHGLSEWGTTQDAAQLFTADQRRAFQISIRDMNLSIENFEDLDEATSWAGELMSQSLEALEVDEITWMGTRMHWFSAVDSFADLRDWLVERFGSVGAAAINQIDRKPSDVGVVLEFKDQKPLINMRFGPMEAQQAMEQLFRDKDATRFPDQFLFLDIDRVYADEHLRPSDALAKWNERVHDLSTLGAQLATAIAAA